MAPLSRELGGGLPKVREFWWDLSLAGGAPPGFDLDI
jgi:hypothetical protein